MQIIHHERYTEYRILDEFGFTAAVFIHVRLADKVDLFAYLTDTAMRYVGNVHI